MVTTRNGSNWLPKRVFECGCLLSLCCIFALKEMVTVHINFMAASTHDARFNDWEAKFSVKHQLEIMTG
jgi:hypothetical protein